ncbi:S-adenosyl-L-methionine-dependent methyltransferase [Elsinoe ampelina]|uniref:tRNA (adenine(58)-N(1))-methyltransferase catalytic subunit TRM61 n=1 Tax=Elsinoe ampelina TaxID=302913 RepID=A0A6A6G790_9PEZI|nr:S-adenosyl-L-methionine-dependent methyltransferase [Elsinoe ampelina]
MLEAGTGHGALTLHLSRAINGGNLPRTPDQSEDEWRASRQAILHTVDISEKYSKHAEKVVAGFRQGMYAGNVNFNVGSVSDWVQAEIESRGHSEPFLSNAFLDLPGLEDHLASVSSTLLPDAKLIVFAPSITQILACFEKARKDRLPLILGQVVELGTNGSSGGREWDIRAVVPRDKLKKREVPHTKAEIAEETSSDESLSETGVVDNAAPAEQVEPAAQQPDADEKLVCRPKVGDRITGGGFLAVFIKKGQDG